MLRGRLGVTLDRSSRPPEREVNDSLRDEPDPDPTVEAMTARLRRVFPNSLGVDEWGRPVAYRHVVRTALSALPIPAALEMPEQLRREALPVASQVARTNAITLPDAQFATRQGAGGVEAPAPDGGARPQPTGLGWPG